VGLLHNLGNIRKTEAVLNAHDILCVSEIVNNGIEQDVDDFVVKTSSIVGTSDDKNRESDEMN
jgi:hypothetical protein